MTKQKYHKIRARNTRNPTKQITYHSGTEGPRHDPYGYDEYVGSNSKGLKARLHLGALCTWLEIEGEPRVRTFDLMPSPKLLARGMRGLELAERRADRILIKRWEHFVGTTIKAVDAYHNSREPDPMGCLADYV